MAQYNGYGSCPLRQWWCDPAEFSKGCYRRDETLAVKKQQRVDPDQELIGLGAANVWASLTGGLSRSVVNFDAKAETPAVGAYMVGGLAIAAVALTPPSILPALGDLGCHHHCGDDAPC